MTALAAAPASRSPGPSRRLPTALAGAALGLGDSRAGLAPLATDRPLRACRARRPRSLGDAGTGSDPGRIGIGARRVGLWAGRAVGRRSGRFRHRRGSAGTGLRPRRARTVRLRRLQSGPSGALAARRAGSRARLRRDARRDARDLQRLLRPGVSRPDDRGLHVLPQGFDRGRLADRLRPHCLR